MRSGTASHVAKITRHRQVRTLRDHYVNLDILIAQEMGSKLNEFLKKHSSSSNQSPNEKIAASQKAA